MAIVPINDARVPSVDGTVSLRSIRALYAGRSDDVVLVQLYNSLSHFHESVFDT